MEHIDPEVSVIAQTLSFLSFCLYDDRVSIEMADSPERRFSWAAYRDETRRCPTWGSGDFRRHGRGFPFDRSDSS